MDDDLERKIDAFEKLSGLSVCLYDFWLNLFARGTGREVRSGLQIHRTPFCMAVKGRSMNRCQLWDHNRLFPAAASAREPFVRTCHAGAAEVVVPVHFGSQLGLIAFIGQFTVRPRKVPGLTAKSEEEVAILLAAGAVLGGSLRDHFSGAGTGASRESGFVRDVREFIATNLGSNPTVADAAAAVGLSPSRTRHRITEETGGTFTGIRDELRLDTARRLLLGTVMPVRAVAETCGFADPNYFYRWFKGQLGISPGGFRRAARTPVPLP